MYLSPAEHELLRRLRASLEATFGERLAQLVVFGSRARGTGHEESDLDVLVLVDGLTSAERRQIIDHAYDLELDAGLRLSPLVRDTASWPPQSLLAAEIARDGAPV